MARLITAVAQSNDEAEKKRLLDRSSELYGENGVLIAEINGVLEQPVLSRTGREVAGMHKDKLTVFKLADDGRCTIVRQLPYRSNKVNFSQAEPGKLGKLTFTSQFQDKLYILDLDSKRGPQVFQTPYHRVSAPGFTKDGRLLFIGHDSLTSKSTLNIYNPKCDTTSKGGVAQ